MSELHEGDWLLVDIDGEIVNFGLAKPSSTPSIHSVKSYKTDNFPTATDCFNNYAKDINIRLNGRPCGLTVSGATKGDTIRIQRCRWIISLTGISYLTGSRPLLINDSVAKSWMNLGSGAAMFPRIGGADSADFSKPGKWVTINYNRGLGAALLSRTAEQPLAASESECGHIGFAPQNELEREILIELAKTKGRVTYEHVLFIDATDPLWNNLSKPTTTTERERIRAGIFGSFAGDITLAFAGWSGVYLHGEKSQFLGQPEYASIFNKRFEEKGSFSNNIRPVPRYFASREATNLPGVAQMMVASNLAK